MAMLKALDYAWHQAHSYRLHALPVEFFYVDLGHRQWTTGQRPIPENFGGVITADEARQMAEDCDFALLHLDQWCGTGFNLRAMPFRLMKQISESLPRAVIIHGTPDDEDNRQEILRLIDDLPVVCNSFQAAGEWDGGDGRLDCHGLPQFRTIIHGYDVEEFHSNPLEQRKVNVITICSGGHTSRKYHGIPVLERLLRDVPLSWYGPHGNTDWLPNYDAYRDMLASSLIYFSPTRRAPMPGARTEAMLSGCCIVTVPGHDVEQFIDHEKTGFIVDTYEQARDTLSYLGLHPEEAWEIGQAGREVARAIFHKDRFVADWLRELGLLGVDVPGWSWNHPDCDPRRDALAFIKWPELFQSWRCRGE